MTMPATTPKAPPAVSLGAGMSARNQRARTDEMHLPYVDLLDRVAVWATRDASAYQRIRANQRRIQEWFSAHTGWAVQITPEYARLIKIPSRVLAGHGLLGHPFTAREYAMMIWILWYAEKANADQFTVTLLAKEIQDRSSEVVAPPYIDWNLRDHRAALRVALQALEQMGMIELVDGDLRPYVDDGSGDALYEYTALAAHTPILLADETYHRVVVEQNIAGVDVVASHDTALELRAYRSLLLCSAVHAADDPDVFQYIRQQQKRIGHEILARFGWALEVTRAYAAVIRPAQDTRGRTVFPTPATEMALPLLLANTLRSAVAAKQLTPDPATDCLVVSPQRLSTYLLTIRREHRDAWSQELASLDDQALTTRTLGLLETWGMAHGPDAVGMYHVRPVLGRFAGVYRADGAGLGPLRGEDDPYADVEDSGAPTAI